MHARGKESEAVGIKLKPVAAMALLVSAIAWLAAGAATVVLHYLGQPWMAAFTAGTTGVFALLVLVMFFVGGESAMRVTVPAVILHNLDRRFDSDNQRERIRRQAGSYGFLWGGLVAAAQLLAAVLIVNS